MTMTKEDQGVQPQPFDEVLWKKRGYALADEVNKYVKAAEAHEVTQWAIGDWLLQGVDGLGGEFKMYEEAKRITGWAHGTLEHAVRTARRFPIPLRSGKEHPGVSALRWSHF